jgi:geranylgeranyl diphosphate synthase type II
MPTKRRTSTLPSLKAYLTEQRVVVEHVLEGFVPRCSTPPARLHEAMRYSVFSGGKRLRPILALAAFELTGGHGGAVLAPACAAELIHTYSLIHDDLPAMDDDDLRRGRPTCHRVFGEAMAVLAGDGLLTLAFELVAGEERIPPEARLAIVRELARANGPCGMVGGQAADIECEGRTPTLAAIDFIHTRKTAMPLAAAVAVGAIAAGADDEDRAALAAYGQSIGLAFQIADDLLDETGTEEEMGKAVGKDRARGKLTYPAVVGMEEAGARARSLSAEAIACLGPFGDRAWVLSEIARFIVERRN